jgi:hypothetical protein
VDKSYYSSEGSPPPVTPPVDRTISSLCSAESAESSSRTERDEISNSNMRMIEDPVLTLCHFPSPGSINPELPERKKARVLPCVSLSLLCFSPPTATSPPPPSSPQLKKDSFNSPPNLSDNSSSLDKLDLSTTTNNNKSSLHLHHHPSSSADAFDKVEDSLNTPVTAAAAGSGFFGTSVPILDPPPIGKSLITMHAKDYVIITRGKMAY